MVSPGAYPARLEGRLERPLSPWLWLVKWFLLRDEYPPFRVDYGGSEERGALS